MTAFRLLVINTAERNNLDYTKPVLTIAKDPKINTELIHWTDLCDQGYMNSFDRIIISASPKGNNANFFERLKAFRWLKIHRKPVLGICAGHQLIGVTFGGKLITGREKEEGRVKVKRLNNDPIFKGLDLIFNTQQHHNDSITLPREFELLASSENCRIQAMRHRILPIYSVQWHAEISNPEIIRNFIS